MRRFARLAVIAIAIATAANFTGCQTFGSGSARAFDADGIPHERYYVGGGFMVDYTAPAAGTVYWTDNAARKVIVTQSVEAGERFESPGSMPQPKEYEKVMGSPLRDAKFMLYFIPNEPNPQG